MRQSLTQKTRGVGDVIVHIHRMSGVEQVILSDVPNPREAVNVINQVAHQARMNAQTVANTRHISSNAAPSAPVEPAAPAVSNEPDAMEQLAKLGQLRDAGVLTEEEFAQKKAEILARM